MHVDPVPPAARKELERLARRWQQLPLDRALQCVPAVHALAQRCADAAAGEGVAAGALPDLGPGVGVDQLVVTVYDRCAAGGGEGVAAELAALRRHIG